MKQRLLLGYLVSALIIFSFSCKKGDSTPDSYVKFKKNGTWVTFSAVGELGPDLADDSKTNLGVSGASDNQDEAFDISIQINGSNFTTGVYNSDNFSYWTLVNYVKGMKTGNLEYFQIEDDPATNTPSVYQVTITSITSTEIAGSFTGNYLYNSFGGTASVVQITEGSFKVKRVR